MSIREVELDQVPNLHGRELFDYQIGQLPPPVPRGRRSKKERPPAPTYYIPAPKRKNVSFRRPVYSVDSSDKLYDLVVSRKGGIKYNPRLVTKNSALQYLSDKNIEDKYNVLSGDFDDDVDTPDNVIIVDEQGRRRYIDGYSLVPRRPDVLYADDLGVINYDLSQGTITKEVADAKKRDIKKYNKTHVTPQSRADEPIGDFLNRVSNERKYNVLHKLYLDRYPKEQRNENLEKAYKTQILNSFPNIAIGPAMLIRRTLSQQIKALEAQGHRFRDKFGLINDIYLDLLNEYRKTKNIPDDYKLIGDDYLQIVTALREKGLANTYRGTLSAYALPPPS